MYELAILATLSDTVLIIINNTVASWFQHSRAKVIYQSKTGCMRELKSLKQKRRLNLNNVYNEMKIEIVSTYKLVKYHLNSSHMIFNLGPYNFHIRRKFGSFWDWEGQNGRRRNNSTINNSLSRAQSELLYKVAKWLPTLNLTSHSRILVANRKYLGRLQMFVDLLSN